MSAVKNIPLSSAPTQSAKSTLPARLRILTIVTVIAAAFGLYMALGFAGVDTEQGEVQRIFYIHMSSFFGAFTAFIGTVIGGIQYLRTRDSKWDTLALAGVEVGFALALVNLITGSVWARPIWNTWWTGDPRLVSALVMVLTYAAYLALRSGFENPEQRKRFASIYGILAITTVLATLFIIRIRPDTIHPAIIGPSPQNAEGTPSMGPTQLAALLVNLPIWGLLIPITLMWWRIRLQNFADRVEALKISLMEQ